MPSVSKKQHNTMQAAKHNPAFAKKVGIPQKVAREFVAADKRVGRYQKRKKVKAYRKPGKRRYKIS